MKVINITKKRFENLKPLELSSNVFNTEAEIFLYPTKEAWKNKLLVLKKLYRDTGEIFGNKLYTINELIYRKDDIDIDELVIPEFLAAINSEIVGFTMPYIPNINFQDIMCSSEFSNKQKIVYLKEIGELLEKMRKLRKYTEVKDFYLNDIHESNFILNTLTNRINVVDLDSSKISNNLASPARYLTPMSQIYFISKYEHKENSIGGIYKIDENTEIYCYIVMILKYLYGSSVNRLSMDEFYSYLNYLSNIGISKELIDIFSLIYEGRDNINPYEYLDELIPYFGKAHKNVFECARKRIFTYSNK